MVRLGEIVERLGRLIGAVAVDPTPVLEPVPDWPAERLIHTVGLAPAEVAALELPEAVDRWTEFCTRLREA
ncbi:hypothetical protein [Embleya sp. NPDC020630]|uniref:hypothetical protein n=1 Tax=Embleya sp. NPDC020630 TaxID=3363979 RepID=UPI003788171A